MQRRVATAYALIMAGRQPFVSRHPLVAIVIILAVELALLGTLHLVLGWSYLARRRGGPGGPGTGVRPDGL